MRKLFLISLIICTMILFSACSESVSVEETSTIEAENSVTALFEAMKSVDMTEISHNMNMNDFKNVLYNVTPLYRNEYDENAFCEKWFPTVSCSNLSSEYIDNETVKVTMDITSRKALDVYMGIFEANISQLESMKSYLNGGTYLDESTLYDMIDNIMNENDFSTETTNVTVQVRKTAGGWQIVPDYEFVNAVIGNMDEASKFLQSAMDSTGITWDDLKLDLY